MSLAALRNHSDSGGPGKSPGHRRWIVFCAGATLLLYWFLPLVAATMSSAIPSHAFEVFPWVAKVDYHTLAVARDNLSVVQQNWRFFVFCAALFAIYGFMLRLAKQCRCARSQAALFAIGAVCILSLVFAPVMLSTDVYAYAFYGRVLSIHGSNPYAPGADAAADPFFALFNRQALVSVYGPLWTLISAGLTRIAGENVGLTVLLFRGFSALSAVAAGAFIWKSLRFFAPERAGQGLVMFLWNPLIIIESGLSGHNDMTMVALAALGVWLHFKGWKTGAVVALTLSALVKFLTGMLVPLYLLMVLRGMQGWRGRILFLLRSCACAGVVAAAVVVFARVGSGVPAAPEAASPGFYMNNFHELVFKGLRRLLGENTEPLMAPTDGTFEPWWAVANTRTILLAEPPSERDNTDFISPAYSAPGIIARIEKGQKLIVITPTLIPWLRVYDSASGKMGFVWKLDTDKLPDPGALAPDPKLRQLALPVEQWPTVVTANLWLRIATWALFAAFGLLAACKTTDIDSFLVWSGAALLASYFLVMTQIWPWYISWALAFGALKPGRLPARLAVLLSGFVPTLYLTLGYDGGDQAWIYNWRSMPAIVLPLLVFLVTLVLWRPGKSQDVPAVAVASVP